MYGRMLVCLEAAFQSVPQALMQTIGFVILPDGISVNLYLFSVICSISVVSFALIGIAQHRQGLLQIASPPACDFAANLAIQSEAAHQDPASLLSDIAAAREAGVASAESYSAVRRLKEMRVAHARQLHSNGASVKVLFDAGYTPNELFAAGVSAGELRIAGLWMQELTDLGFSLQALKEAGYSTQALHAAGHSLGGLIGAGATAIELKALAAFSVAEMRNAGLGVSALSEAGYDDEELKSAGFSSTDLKNAGWSAKRLRLAGYTATELKQVGCSIFELKAAGFSNHELNERPAPILGSSSSAQGSSTTLLLEDARPSDISTEAGTAVGRKVRKNGKLQLTDGMSRDAQHDENSVYTKLPPNFPDDTSTSWLNCRVVPPPEHRPMPPTQPAPIFNSSGQQINKQVWSSKTMGYIGTNAFAR